MSDVLKVERREIRGKHRIRRLRAAGSVPAVIYGHGGDSIPLTVPADQVAAATRHGGRLVELTGAISEKALITALQWDVYGKRVLHMDLLRVVEGETVTLQVPLEIRGDAPGVKDGGHVDLVLHELEIECPVTSIPEKISLSVRNLQLNGQILASEVTLPEGATLVTEADTVVVTCHEVKEVEEGGAGGEAAEPELIGRKAAEGSEEEEG